MMEWGIILKEYIVRMVFYRFDRLLMVICRRKCCLTVVVVQFSLGTTILSHLGKAGKNPALKRNYGLFKWKFGKIIYHLKITRLLHSDWSLIWSC